MAKQKSTKTIKPAQEAGPIRSAIKRMYDKTAPLLLLESILFIIAAVIVFIQPIQILTVLTLMFGIVLALFGLYQTFAGIFDSGRDASVRSMNIVFGIVNVILGVVFFMQPAGSLFAIIYIFAALFLFKGIKALILSVQLWKAKFGHYVISTMLSLAMIALAVAMLFIPAIGAITAMYYIGAILLFYGLSDMYIYSELRKLKKRING